MEENMAKYSPIPRVHLENREWPSKTITQHPIWSSVDLRDGNQALQTPMSIKTKLDFFNLLLETGFKEIEVGFPAASQIEFDYIRQLIDENRIPADVTVQVLCQARQHLIARTIDSLKGAKKAIFHLYNSTSPLQRKVTFNKSKEEILKIAVEGVKILKQEISRIPETQIILQYSPESFSNTEMDYAVEICNAVYETWAPKAGEKVIFNLPATVESSTANVHADQIEWFCKNISHRDNIIISLHTHNDRGTGVAAAELGLLAGADRVEGTLFGNGERTGNLDIITMALNMFSEGINPGLDFSNILEIREAYEEYTGLSVHARHPYAGDLVYTAFSGSHQDAIQKGMELQKEKNSNEPWEVPYLPIDPKDIGRSYEAIIRFNSQSGKGGAAYLLKEEYGLNLPKQMHITVGKYLNEIADSTGKEISPKDIYDQFKKKFLNPSGTFELLDLKIKHPEVAGDNVQTTALLKENGKEVTLIGEGNGPIDAFVKSIHAHNVKAFKLTDFSEHSLGSNTGSAMEAAAYVALTCVDGKVFWGCGINKDISLAGVSAVLSALNQMP